MIVNVLDAVSTPSLMVAVLWTGVPSARSAGTCAAWTGGRPPAAVGVIVQDWAIPLPVFTQVAWDARAARAGHDRQLCGYRIGDR